MNKNSILSRKLKEARRKLGITVQQAANRCGFIKSRYSNYENNIRKPDANALKALADGLDISVDELTGGTAVMFQVNAKTGEQEMSLDKIPVLTLEQAVNWRKNMTKTKELLPASGLDSKTVFAVELDRKTSLVGNSPRFCTGDFVAIDVSRKPKDGDIILVKISTASSIFKIYRTEGDKIYLLAVDNSSIVEELSKPKNIIGVLCRHYPKPRDF